MNKHEFRYVFKDTTSDLIIIEYFSLDDIEQDEVNEFISSESSELGSPIKLVARNPYVGQTDSSDKKIYVEDIIEYLGYEVHDGKQVYPKRRMVVENKIECLSKLMTVTSSLKGIVIGNIYENSGMMKMDSAYGVNSPLKKQSIDPEKRFFDPK